MALSTDPFLDNISDASLQVLERFGPEAPIRLHTYACNLEQTLHEALGRQEVLRNQVLRLQNEQQQLRSLLTDPDQLIDYVSDFFGAQGPCPGGAVISRFEPRALAV
ncbi:hypothetical protein [Cyanobium sp. CH-040]|uniref:hypothetical protein n=1 Tax=Cyanobium sp. CH-040 TaxID=2823708 RepID=UPI0020CBA787|nr:hypothetical protein [Cyanobium sp. CH-040]MCP9928828.1 hypothetical protein [Cyanobium sp. CH-040]